MKPNQLILASAVSVVLILGCGGDDEPPATGDAAIPPQLESTPESSSSPVQVEPTAMPSPTASPEATWLILSEWDAPDDALIALAGDVLSMDFQPDALQGFEAQESPGGTNYNAEVEIAGARLTFSYEQTGGQTSGGSITVEESGVADDSLDSVLATFDKYFIGVETDQTKWQKDTNANGIVFWEAVVERSGGVLQTWSAYSFQQRDQTMVVGVASCVIFPNSAVYEDRTCFAQ